jgi:phthiocerol/phenolphthiocerol synthesis type-I polyketide synthase E
MIPDYRLPTSQSLIDNSAELRPIRDFYNEANHRLNEKAIGSKTFFLNYGYLRATFDGCLTSAMIHKILDRWPDSAVNTYTKNSVALLVELIGDERLEGRRVLEVGCGRGGNLIGLQLGYQPALLAGIDLSSAAISTCKSLASLSDVSLTVGDAEFLPYSDAAFEAVVNIESAHCYPHPENFFQEVYRVLSPKGLFFFTDLLPSDQSDRVLGLLESNGFSISSNRDITKDVVRACDELLEAPDSDFGDHDYNAKPAFELVLQGMKNGRSLYRLVSAVKT